MLFTAHCAFKATPRQLAFELASRIAAIMPEELDRIFFTSSGSESVDTALKIVLLYQRSIGKARA